MSNSDQLVSAVRSLPADQQAAIVASIAGDIVRSNEGLRADNERLTRERNEANKDATHCLEQLSLVCIERDQLRKQLAAAQKDSEIIDWLERKGLSTIHTGVTPEIGVHCWEDRDNNCRKWTARHISSEFTSLRSAARAAIDREATDEAV